MRRVATLFCFVALLAVAYGGFNLWQTAQQLNQVSANFAGRSSVRQPDPTEERAHVPLDIESLPPDVDVQRGAVVEDAGFGDSLATEPEIDARSAALPLEETYAESGFDEAYVEPELDPNYPGDGAAEPAADEVFDDFDPSAALQALLSDPDPAVREEAAALLEALQSQELQNPE
jgi:hypothetical protein